MVVVDAISIELTRVLPQTPGQVRVADVDPGIEDRDDRAAGVTAAYTVTSATAERMSGRARSEARYSSIGTPSGTRQ
jgi:hypothetical protein